MSLTFFNTAHWLPKDLMFEHGGAKLFSCPGAIQPRGAPQARSHGEAFGAVPPKFFFALPND